MVSSLTAWLMSFAEWTQMLTIFSVFSVFLLTSILIGSSYILLRIIGIAENLDNNFGGGGVTVVYDPPRQTMKKLDLPATLSLNNNNQTNDDDDDKISFVVNNSDDDFQIVVKAFWKVKISSFFQILSTPKPKLRWFSDAFTFGRLFGDDCARYEEEDPKIIRTSDPTVVEWNIPEVEGDLGPAPRDYYPLVLVLQSADTFVFYPVHIRDSVCALKTQILDVYLKSSSLDLNGSWVHLQPLYGESVCVICRTLKATRVLLPCRHACACQFCFKKLKNQCPLCRSFIQSFFVTDPDLEERLIDQDPDLVDEDENSDEETSNYERRSWRQRFEELNHRFTMALGFQDN